LPKARESHKLNEETAIYREKYIRSVAKEVHDEKVV
jgi:hypothetical protein